MQQMIFVNLPCQDVARARAFYTGLGHRINEQFSDETTICVVVSDTIFFMVMTRDRFAGFAPRPVADPQQVTAALIALMTDSRAAVDAYRDRALAAGGSDNHKTQDYGFMYSHSLSDPDGNVIEIGWMDPAAAQGDMPPDGADDSLHQ